MKESIQLTYSFCFLVCLLDRGHINPHYGKWICDNLDRNKTVRYNDVEVLANYTYDCMGQASQRD